MFVMGCMRPTGREFDMLGLQEGGKHEVKSRKEGRELTVVEKVAWPFHRGHTRTQQGTKWWVRSWRLSEGVPIPRVWSGFTRRSITSCV